MQRKLLALMKLNNITYKDLSKELGITEKQVGAKIRDKADFKSSEMFKISNILHEKMDEIFVPPMYEKRTIKLNKKESSHDANQELDSTVNN